MAVKSLFRQLLFFGCFFLVVSANQADAQAQRMLLLPTSSVELIGPGESRVFDALCLDYHRDTPGRNVVFESAPGGSFGNATVKTGRSRIDLNHAIQSGAVSITGTGSTSSVRINNDGSRLISVSVPGASVVTPPGNSSTSDLAGLPQIGATKVASNQNSLWLTRTLMDAGMKADDKNLVRRAKDYADIVGWMYPSMGGWPPKGRVPIAIHRVENKGAVRFILYGPEARAKIVLARDLSDLIPEIQNIAERAGVKARIYVFGDGTRSDLDAAEMTLSFGESGYIVGRDFDFGGKEPDFPDRFGWGRGGGGGRDTPLLADDDGWRSKIIPFLTRGTVKVSVQSKVVNAWEHFLARMSVGVVEAEEEPQAATASVSEVRELIEDHIQKNIDVIKRRLNYGSIPPGVARSTSDLEGALFNREYVEVWVGSTRVAVLEFQSE